MKIKGATLVASDSMKNLFPAVSNSWVVGQIPRRPFYKRGCQDKCFPHNGKAQGKWFGRPAGFVPA